MNFKVVIPARYASTRLPGKPLLDIGGKPMVQWVHERALQSGAEQVVVATDDKRIADCVSSFGGEVCMTNPDHRSGTDRIAEVARVYGWSAHEIVVNLQGDEPDMPSALLLQVAEDMHAHQDAVMTTLCAGLTEKAQLFDPNVVKLVTDQKGYALYFSRAPIPWDREQFSDQSMIPEQVTGFYRHIGLYAYRVGFLARYVTWPPSPLETIESLEQLRVLWQGERIHVSEAAEMPGQGIDTQQDLDRINQQFNKNVD
ncbi:MAG: 3-deoxy-manno-octulosonate cytidylyltransferase [Sedimenticola sp.]|nr:3-deoxy-manno-octulosonate cytidylyltransferase [Sedimenticola sp.]